MEALVVKYCLTCLNSLNCTKQLLQTLWMCLVNENKESNHTPWFLTDSEWCKGFDRISTGKWLFNFSLWVFDPRITNSVFSRIQSKLGVRHPCLYIMETAVKFFKRQGCSFVRQMDIKLGVISIKVKTNPLMSTNNIAEWGSVQWEKQGTQNRTLGNTKQKFTIIWQRGAYFNWLVVFW